MAQDFKNYYRPLDFDEIVGQDSSVSIFKGMLKKNKIANSILITGPYGTGKTTFARIFAKHVCCLDYNSKELKPCGKCSSCKGFDVGNKVERHISICEVNAGSETGVDYYRSLMNNAKRKPFGKYIVYIIDEAHKMSTAAQDAFLKMLEEPPSHAIFIFCTTERHKLLATIQSRLTTITLSKIKKEDSVKYLKRVCKKEKAKVKNKILSKISEVSDGHLRDAVSILETYLNAIEDGKKIKIKDIYKIIDSSEVSNPFKVASEYLKGVFAGKYSTVKYITSLDDSGVFLMFNKVLSGLLIEAMYAAINSNLACKTNDAWKYKNICSFILNFTESMDEKTKTKFVGYMASMSDDLVLLIERMNNFGVNSPRYLCNSFTFMQAKRFKDCSK